MTDKPTNQNDAVKIVTPENTLKEKLGEGGIPSEKIAKAEKTMADSSEKFIDIARGDMTVIAEAITAAKADNKKVEQIIREINAASFELKSNAGMFDYPVVADVATSLYQLTDMLDDLNTEVIKVLELHYQTLQATIKLGGKLDDTDQTKELIKGLMKASSQVLS